MIDKPKPVNSREKTGDCDCRDEKGRFAPGHRHAGPGRPPKEVETAYLDVFRATITPGELEAVLLKLLQMAKAGDVRAAEVLLKRCVPEKAVIEQMIEASVATTAAEPISAIAAYRENPELLQRALQLGRDMNDPTRRKNGVSENEYSDRTETPGTEEDDFA